MEIGMKVLLGVMFLYWLIMFLAGITHTDLFNDDNDYKKRKK